MARGWFDLFRDGGGPTLYAYSNRTPVIGDSTSITLYIVFATLFLAFFVIFPGIRKERFTTFLSVTLSLFVGVSILIGTCANGWHTAEAEISSAYRSFSNEKIQGRMGIYIGLVSANVTLEAMPTYYGNRSMDVNFNEKFGFERPTQLKEEYAAALKKGLPFPILTVAEYLSVDAEGFCWGRTYRAAGYYTCIFLWSSFALWILMNMLLMVVPRYGAYAMSLTGLMMLWSTTTYYLLLPRQPLKVHIDEVVLHFELGWCFWLVLVSGSCCTLVGFSISIIDLMYPHKFSTVLEMDYGTPFDRHTIIEDSHETKKKKKWVPKLEDPNGGFGGLLRRFSKRDGREGFHRHPAGGRDLHRAAVMNGGGGPGGHGGADNFAFEMDMPKSPWRYPHLMFRADSRKAKGVSFKQDANQPPPMGSHLPNYLRRTDSKDSSCSSMSSSQHRDLGASMSMPAHFHKQFKRTDSSDSNTSSLASFGLGFLSRNGSKKKGPAPHATAHHQLHLKLEKQHNNQLGSPSGGHPLAQSPLARASNPPELALGGHHPLTAVASGKHRAIQRGDSTDSVMARLAAGTRVEEIATSSSSGASTSTGTGSGASSRKTSDEHVAIVVTGSRKNSLTKRRNSAEHKREEAALW